MATYDKRLGARRVTADQAAARRTASRVAARAEIRDVRLLSSHAELFRQRQPPFTYDFESDLRIEYETGDPVCVIACSYDLRVTEAPTSEGAATPRIVDTAGYGEALGLEAQSIAELRFEYGALVSLRMRDGDAQATTEELEAYAATTGQFALYPFARQYVYDVTGRLGLPPLLLGVLQVSFEPETDHVTPKSPTLPSPANKAAPRKHQLKAAAAKSHRKGKASTD